MAGQRVIECVGPSYWLRDRKTAVQRSINCYPMLSEDVGALVLESAPGLDLVASHGEIRGMRAADGRLFLVAGATLYEMVGGVLVSRGALGSSSGYVAMVNGQGQLAIVDGVNLYVFSLATNTLAAVVSAGWLGSRTVQFLDGYFLFVEPGTERAYISAVDDASALDALDFTSADTQPDNIVMQIVTRREWYLIGSRSTEPWINSGGADFPFARYQGTPIDVGAVGYRSACATSDGLVMVGQSISGGPYVYQLQAYQPVRISTQAVEQQLEASTDLTECRVWTYQEAGSEFVAVWAPGMATTWVWDAATKLWHERGEFVNGAWVPSRVEHVAYFEGRHYAAGNGALYRMSREYSTLAGDTLMRERTWAHLVSPSLEAMPFAGLELRCTTGDAVAGSITLELSNDGGAVFGPPLRRSLGAEGRRAHRVRWMALGTCPAGGSRVHRLRCNDAVPLTIQGATLS